MESREDSFIRLFFLTKFLLRIKKEFFLKNERRTLGRGSANFVRKVFALTPVVLTPVVLTPVVLTPVVLTPVVLTPVVLTPFVLTP
jgi:hypothetical protein